MEIEASDSARAFLGPGSELSGLLVPAKCGANVGAAMVIKIINSIRADPNILRKKIHRFRDIIASNVERSPMQRVCMLVSVPTLNEPVKFAGMHQSFISKHAALQSDGPSTKRLASLAHVIAFSNTSAGAQLRCKVAVGSQYELGQRAVDGASTVSTLGCWCLPCGALDDEVSQAPDTSSHSSEFRPNLVVIDLQSRCLALCNYNTSSHAHSSCNADKAADVPAGTCALHVVHGTAESDDIQRGSDAPWIHPGAIPRGYEAKHTAYLPSLVACRDTTQVSSTLRYTPFDLAMSEPTGHSDLGMDGHEWTVLLQFKDLRDGHNNESRIWLKGTEPMSREWWLWHVMAVAGWTGARGSDGFVIDSRGILPSGWIKFDSSAGPAIQPELASATCTPPTGALAETPETPCIVDVSAQPTANTPAEIHGDGKVGRAVKSIDGVSVPAACDSRPMDLSSAKDVDLGMGAGDLDGGQVTGVRFTRLTLPLPISCVVDDGVSPPNDSLVWVCSTAGILGRINPNLLKDDVRRTGCLLQRCGFELEIVEETPSRTDTNVKQTSRGITSLAQAILVFRTGKFPATEIPLIANDTEWDSVVDVVGSTAEEAGVRTLHLVAGDQRHAADLSTVVSTAMQVTVADRLPTFIDGLKRVHPHVPARVAAGLFLALDGAPASPSIGPLGWVLTSNMSQFSSDLEALLHARRAFARAALRGSNNQDTLAGGCRQQLQGMSKFMLAGDLVDTSTPSSGSALPIMRPFRITPRSFVDTSSRTPPGLHHGSISVEMPEPTGTQVVIMPSSDKAQASAVDMLCINAIGPAAVLSKPPQRIDQLGVSMHPPSSVFGAALQKAPPSTALDAENIEIDGTVVTSGNALPNSACAVQPTIGQSSSTNRNMSLDLGESPSRDSSVLEGLQSGKASQKKKQRLPRTESRIPRRRHGVGTSRNQVEANLPLPTNTAVLLKKTSMQTPNNIVDEASARDAQHRAKKGIGGLVTADVVSSPVPLYRDVHRVPVKLRRSQTWVGRNSKLESTHHSTIRAVAAVEVAAAAQQWHRGLRVSADAQRPDTRHRQRANRHSEVQLQRSDASSRALGLQDSIAPRKFRPVLRGGSTRVLRARLLAGNDLDQIGDSASSIGSSSRFVGYPRPDESVAHIDELNADEDSYADYADADASLDASRGGSPLKHSGSTDEPASRLGVDKWHWVTSKTDAVALRPPSHSSEVAGESSDSRAPIAFLSMSSESSDAKSATSSQSSADLYDEALEVAALAAASVARPLGQVSSGSTGLTQTAGVTARDSHVNVPTPHALSTTRGKSSMRARRHGIANGEAGTPIRVDGSVVVAIEISSDESGSDVSVATSASSGRPASIPRHCEALGPLHQDAPRSRFEGLRVVDGGLLRSHKGSLSEPLSASEASSVGTGDSVDAEAVRLQLRNLTRNSARRMEVATSQLRQYGDRMLATTETPRDGTKLGASFQEGHV